MRRPRRRQPGQFLDVTIRCHNSRFRFLPTKERSDIIGFWLAKAQKRFPGIRVLAVCQMGNHLHLCVYDQEGELSRFCQYAFGFIAKAINRIDQLRGAVFERRFSEISILDYDAVAWRISYAIANPVAANLVRSHRDWTGLCFFARAEAVTHRFTVFHDDRYRRALRDAERTGAAVNRNSFFEIAELEIAGVGHEIAREIATAIDERETELRQHQTGVLGMHRVLQSSPLDHPEVSERSRMPLCFASTHELRRSFADGWYTFVAAFREASAAFRAGFLTAVFPRFSFRPTTSTS